MFLSGVLARAASLLRTDTSLAEGMQVVQYSPEQVRHLMIYQAPACSTDTLTIITAVQHYHAHADYHTGKLVRGLRNGFLKRFPIEN